MGGGVGHRQVLKSNGKVNEMMHYLRPMGMLPRLLSLALCVLCGALALGLLPVSLTLGQMITTTTPAVSVGDRYYENFGVGFGFGFPAARGNGSRVVGLGPNGQLRPSISFNQNLGVIPPFGGFNPGAGANFGFGVRGSGGGGFNLGFNLAKGNTRTNVTQAPYLTTMNGAMGSISDTRSQPFVIGNIPVLGGMNRGTRVIPPYENGVTRALRMGSLEPTAATEEYAERPTRGPVSYGSANSSAARGALSVDRIKAERQDRLQAQKELAEQTMEEAQDLVEAGKRLDARMKLRAVLKNVEDEALKLALKRMIDSTRR